MATFEPSVEKPVGEVSTCGAGGGVGFAKAKASCALATFCSPTLLIARTRRYIGCWASVGMFATMPVPDVTSVQGNRSSFEPAAPDVEPDSEPCGAVPVCGGAVPIAKEWAAIPDSGSVAKENVNRAELG